MKLKFLKKLWLRITACVMALITIFSTSGCAKVLAWMSDNGMSSPIDITSNVHKAYFESGDGTKDIVRDESGEIISGPFEIANPLQLYYFSWLQYLGFFNVDNDENGEIDTLYFRLSKNIDMKYINEDGEEVEYVLPPIGTKEHPFLGNFDGEGHTISDLTVENSYDNLFEAPDGTDEESFDKTTPAEIIGFFGVVGELPDKDYNYSSIANEVKNFVLENITVKTQTSSALIGLVAGYVNGIVDCVGVVGSQVDIKAGTQTLTYTNNLSDYSLIGYCTPECKNEIYLLGSSVKNPEIPVAYTVVPDNTSGGSSHGWGGSVKMTDIYTWLSTLNSNNNSTNSYINQRTDVVTLDGTTITVSQTNATKKVTTIDGFGSFVFANQTASGINFVGGAQGVTRYTYEYSTNNVTVYYIQDSGYYLTFDGDGISATTTQASATKWYASEGTSGGVLSTVVDGRVYYLTIANGAISVIADIDANPSDLPKWEKSENELTLNGQRVIYSNGQWRIDNTFKISYRANNTTYYVTNNGTNGIQAITNVNQAATWTLTAVDNGYQLSTVPNNTNTTYYLAYNQSSDWWNTTVTGPNLSTSASTWQFDGEHLYVSVNNGWGGGTTTYYLQYNGNTLTIANNQNNSQFSFVYTTTSNIQIVSSNTQEKEIICTQSTSVDTSVENGYYNESGTKVSNGLAGITYFPLSTTVSNGTYSIDSTNTGYIVGSGWSINKDGESELGNYESNLRISRYGTGDLTNSTAPYTISYNTGGKFKTITDDTKASLGLQKYDDCFSDYQSAIQSNLDGLHFMPAAVSKDNKTKITATLSGYDEPIDNYEVPTNCIDFNLYDRGFINFFAGSYYTAVRPYNDSFFSIYQVFRDESDPEKKTIIDIKEIDTIHGMVKTVNGSKSIDTSKPYYYTYTDGTVSELPEEYKPLLSQYEKIFDCQWISDPSNLAGKSNKTSCFGGSGGPSQWENGKAFYFEVPVNAGEYAIGSTEGRTGAYLVYLDLAANAQLVERVREYEKIIETTMEASIPNGVEMLAPAESYDTSKINSSNSAFASINTSASGAIDFDKSDTGDITLSATSGFTAEYIGVDAVLKDGNGNVLSVPISKTTTIERTTYRDYNLNTDETTITVITKTSVEIGGQTTITYTKTVNGELVEPDPNNPSGELFPDTQDPESVAPPVAGANLIDLAFAYGQEVGVTISYLYTPAGVDAEGNATAPTYVITITNPGTDPITVKAILTAEGVASGIKFIIKDGTEGSTGSTLENTQTAQKVEIAVSKETQDTPQDSPSTDA